MITSLEELEFYLRSNSNEIKLDEQQISEFLSEAVFLEGNLRSFKGNILHDNMTVTQFEQFLNEVGAKVVIGKEDAQLKRYGYKWGNIAGRCLHSEKSYCS